MESELKSLPRQFKPMRCKSYQTAQAVSQCLRWGCSFLEKVSHNKNKQHCREQTGDYKKRERSKSIPTMGNSSGKSADETFVFPFEGEMETFGLKKRRPGCTGMFWRPDPTGTTQLGSNHNWPRDGALLRGVPMDVNGKRWLLCRHVKQKGSNQWKGAPVGAAIPFEYSDHYYLAN
jgi:hypothetical protein